MIIQNIPVILFWVKKVIKNGYYGDKGLGLDVF